METKEFQLKSNHEVKIKLINFYGAPKEIKDQAEKNIKFKTSSWYDDSTRTLHNETHDYEEYRFDGVKDAITLHGYVQVDENNKVIDAFPPYRLQEYEEVGLVKPTKEQLNSLNNGFKSCYNSQ